MNIDALFKHSVFHDLSEMDSIGVFGIDWEFHCQVVAVHFKTPRVFRPVTSLFPRDG